ncbi:MAG: adenine deaminase [Candidatus Melainabacteria bacterium]|nr:adenine deaminase [Candidatus Melainabacteria bacterium]
MEISGNLVDCVHETIYPATVSIENGKISSIRRIPQQQKHFLLPGFVDAHIHIESSMLPPSEFARLALPHGIVATVSDPHEIGNVLGVKGVEYMIQNGSTVPFKFNFGAPSCVPATEFETSGARIGPAEIRYLLSKKEVRYLTEVMNFPAVIRRDPEMMAKLAIAKELHKKIDGHAPGVKGEDLKKYVSAGIDTDHECTTVAEAKEKIALGMKILIREGTAARDFDNLFPLLIEAPQHCMLCSDDIDPEFLMHGGVNLLVKKAIERGADLMKVLRCASSIPIQHYGLEVGQLRVGDPADFIEVDNLVDFRVLSTYVDGRLVAKDGKVLFARIVPQKINQFAVTKKKPEDFKVRAEPGKQLRVIEAQDGKLITGQLFADPLIENGYVCADPKRDLLKIAVVNRYEQVLPAVGFINNFGLKRGAIASSVAHDCHNIIAVGVDDESLCKAINCIISHQGGLAVVDNSQEECLPMPIAGLMSDQEGPLVAAQLQKLVALAKSLGCPLASPFMTLAFMALLVIPKLKLSDKGLFDGETFSFVPLFSSK